MTLEERLSKLERQNRWFKRGAAAGLVVVVALLCMAQARPSPPALEASQLVLRDAQGRARLRIEVASDGNPTINILDQEGRLRSSLGPHGLSFYDETGRMRTTLMSDLLYIQNHGSRTGQGSRFLWRFALTLAGRRGHSFGGYCRSRMDSKIALSAFARGGSCSRGWRTRRRIVRGDVQRRSQPVGRAFLQIFCRNRLAGQQQLPLRGDIHVVRHVQVFQHLLRDSLEKGRPHHAPLVPMRDG